MDLAGAGLAPSSSAARADAYPYSPQPVDRRRMPPAPASTMAKRPDLKRPRLLANGSRLILCSLLSLYFATPASASQTQLLCFFSPIPLTTSYTPLHLRLQT
ncbi:hypothetical protein CRG98_046857, partial [Punica granatum]